MKHLSNKNLSGENIIECKNTENKKKDNTWFNRTQWNTLEKKMKKE